MKLDKVTAMQKIADIKVEIDTDLCDDILKLMSRLSKPGAIRRKEFDLNEFLADLAKIDFSKYERADVAKLFEVMGESISDGLWVAGHGFTEGKDND